MDMYEVQLARTALDGVSGLLLGVAITRSGDRVVRVNVAEDAPDGTIKLIHKRLANIPHEIRRVHVAHLESTPR
jgi:hypothetical protein